MIGLLPVRASRSDVVRLASVTTTVDPTAIDDADDGYRIGQRWVNTALLTTWTLVDATPGAAVWVQEDGGGGGGGDPAALGGDLGGTTAAGHVKTVRGVSKTITYDGNGRVSVVTSALGTQTITRDANGKPTGVVGTGQYRNKTITYEAGKPVAVTVS
jgi:YD repeat-containing protein